MSAMKNKQPANPKSIAPSSAEIPGKDWFAPIKGKLFERYSRIYNLSEQQSRTLRKKKEFLISYQQSNGKVVPACRSAHICPKTFYNWYHTDPDFKRATEDIPAYSQDFMEDLLMFLIFLKKDGPSIRYWLDHKHPGYKKPRRRPPIRWPRQKSLSELLDDEEWEGKDKSV